MQPFPLPITDQAGNPIPLDGRAHARIYSTSGTLLARGYTRVVLGGRGAYVEFAPVHMAMENLHIPREQQWRINNEHAFYLEHRSLDEANVKVYEQRRTVSYADYQIGMFYIAPADIIIKT
jgi:hypothetical protein